MKHLKFHHSSYCCNAPVLIVDSVLDDFPPVLPTLK